MSLNYKFVKSRRGNNLLCHEMFLYERDNSRVNSRGERMNYWKCVQYNSNLCPARARTRENGSEW